MGCWSFSYERFGNPDSTCEGEQDVSYDVIILLHLFTQQKSIGALGDTRMFIKAFCIIFLSPKKTPTPVNNPNVYQQ